jgi:hypothetical protein
MTVLRVHQPRVKINVDINVGGRLCTQEMPDDEDRTMKQAFCGAAFAQGNAQMPNAQVPDEPTQVAWCVLECRDRARRVDTDGGN